MAECKHCAGTRMFCLGGSHFCHSCKPVWKLAFGSHTVISPSLSLKDREGKRTQHLEIPHMQQSRAPRKQRRATSLVFFKPLNRTHMKLQLCFPLEVLEFCVVLAGTLKVTDCKEQNITLVRPFVLTFQLLIAFINFLCKPSTQTFS